MGPLCAFWRLNLMFLNRLFKVNSESVGRHAWSVWD